MKRNLMNELTEGIGVLGQLRKFQEEESKIEQILGKALGYPYYKDDPKNFPNATEEDGVCVADHTAWSLAMCAADKIKELQNQVKEMQECADNLVDYAHEFVTQLSSWGKGYDRNDSQIKMAEDAIEKYNKLFKK